MKNTLITGENGTGNTAGNDVHDSPAIVSVRINRECTESDQHAEVEENIQTLLREMQKLPGAGKKLLWYALTLGEQKSMAFHRIAAIARRRERQGDFVFAAALWSVASESAYKVANRKWARSRSELCLILNLYQTSYGSQKLPLYCLRADSERPATDMTEGEL